MTLPADQSGLSVINRPTPARSGAAPSARPTPADSGAEGTVGRLRRVPARAPAPSVARIDRRRPAPAVSGAQLHCGHERSGPSADP